MPFPNHLPIPREVLTIAETLEAAGFDTWCVGGAVRDNLLGLENKDFDLTTAARPEDVQRVFKRTIPIGVDHGTVAVLDRHRKPHEVTTFRRDVTTDGRHATVEFGVSLDEDLARRDFTINAIAHHPLKHEWRDPCDGAGDLERKLIRAVGDPTERFREDYLRILRALRFAARFGFEIELATWEAAAAHAHGLTNLSAERVRDEWFKGLETAQRPSELVELWGEVGALRVWLQELGSGERGAGPDDVRIIDGMGVRDPVLITAYLSRDPEATLRRLRCSNSEIERGAAIQRHRSRWPDPTNDVSVRHWMAEVGQAAADLVEIARLEGRDIGDGV
ncbi:MAG: CCA tRNA nucleotidyltransferase, partial [Gemmatimonadota bacterium]|nr:CCA tRNA nucleotidyltransferase [Gemmatimonadota bacterium]